MGREFKKRKSRKTVCHQRKPKSKNYTLSLDRNLDGNPDSYNVTIALKTYHSDMFINFHKMQKQGRLCDVKLQTETGYVMAHKLILMSASTYFCEKLQGNHYTERESTEKILDVKHIPLDDLIDIVSFIYSGKIVISQTYIGIFAEFCQSLGLTMLFDILAAMEIEIKKEDLLNEDKQPSEVQTSNTENESNETGIGETNISKVRNINNDAKRKSCNQHSVTVEACVNDSTKIRINRDRSACDSNVDEGTDSCDEKDTEVCDMYAESDANGDSEGLCADDDANEQTCDYEDGDLECVPNKRRRTQGLFCRQCNVTFSSQSERDEHKQSCTVIRPRKRCLICKITFSTAEEYMHHRKNDLQCLEERKERHKMAEKRKQEHKRRYSCRVCKFRCKEWADLLDHEFKVHDLPYDTEKWTDMFCEVC